MDQMLQFLGSRMGMLSWLTGECDAYYLFNIVEHFVCLDVDLAHIINLLHIMTHHIKQGVHTEKEARR